MGLLRTKFVQGFIAIFVLYLGIIFLISQPPSSDADDIDQKLQSLSPDNRLELLVQITGVNPLEGIANARVLPWPHSDDVGFTLKSGWVPSQKTYVQVDSVIGASNGGSSLYQFESDIPTGGFDVQIDEQPGEGARADVTWYPFDRYAFEVPIAAYSESKKGDQTTLNILPLDYTKSIDTFDISMEHAFWGDPNRTVSLSDETSFQDAVDEYSNGQSSSVFHAIRSKSTILLVSIILLLMVTAMVSVTILTYMVVKGERPPTLGSLTWTAALTYSLISLRGLMPGAPPIGIFVDKIVYFPSLIITLVCSLWVLVTWVRREDYQA